MEAIIKDIMNSMDNNIGVRFGKLLVVKALNKNRKGTRVYLFKCDCGNELQSTLNRVKLGNKVSCGCINKRHGLSTHPLYGRWGDMKKRAGRYNCTFKKIRKDRYKELNIKVCDEWANDFLSFYNWAIKNGFKKNLVLDRIDTYGDYEPSNCRWATTAESSRNTTKTLYVNGVCLKDYCKSKNISYSMINQRMHRGSSLEEAIKVKNVK